MLVQLFGSRRQGVVGIRKCVKKGESEIERVRFLHGILEARMGDLAVDLFQELEIATFADPTYSFTQKYLARH